MNKKLSLILTGLLVLVLAVAGALYTNLSSRVEMGGLATEPVETDKSSSSAVMFLALMAPVLVFTRSSPSDEQPSETSPVDAVTSTFLKVKSAGISTSPVSSFMLRD